MPVVLEVTSTDLTRCRFALSPLWEVNAAVRVLIRPPTPAWHRGWVQGVDPAAADAIRLLGVLQPPRGWTPDFLAPAPLGPGSTLEAELDRVAGTPVDLVRAELLQTRASHQDCAAVAQLDELLAEPDAGLRRVVAAQRQLGQLVIGPHWLRLRALLDADIAYHGRLLAERGLAGLLPHLHPDVSWQEGRVVVAAIGGERVTLAGQGLVLLPSAFTGPRPVVVTGPPWQPTLVYPARGVAELWAARPAAPAALVGVLGQTRAALLTRLAEPASATALAASYDWPISTVHSHLTVLRRAGLLSARRAGRQVLYVRTPVGDALVASSTE